MEWVLPTTLYVWWVVPPPFLSSGLAVARPPCFAKSLVVSVAVKAEAAQHLPGFDDMSLDFQQLSPTKHLLHP